MKRFDKVLHEAYWSFLGEQAPEMAPPPDPGMGNDLGAAAPDPNAVPEAPEGEQPVKPLSTAAEAYLAEMAYLALYIDPNDINPVVKEQLETQLPQGSDSISPENAKDIIKIIESIVKEENPNLALKSSEETDKKTIDALPAL